MLPQLDPSQYSGWFAQERLNRKNVLVTERMNQGRAKLTAIQFKSTDNGLQNQVQSNKCSWSDVARRIPWSTLDNIEFQIIRGSRVQRGSFQGTPQEQNMVSRMGTLKLATGFICLFSLMFVQSADGRTGQKLGPPLKVDFYKESCPQFDKIVADTVAYFSAQDPTTPAPLLRLFFHDCFVQSCDASLLLNSTTNNTAEKDAAINFSVTNFFVIDDIKAQLEEKCPGIVSCADVLALTAAYSVKQTGGPLYEMELGRRDALTSYAASSQTFIPAETLNVSGLLADFNYIGLNLMDVVTLSGAHTIGQAHCNSVTNRIYPKVDPVYPHNYGDQLYTNCTDHGAIKPPAFNPNVQFFNDPITPLIFDNQYFKNLEHGLGLFTSDFSLFSDPRTVKLVQMYASNQSLFFKEFGKALNKMGRANVLTGTQGQIRKQCWVPNPNNADPAFDPVSNDFTDH